MINKNSFILLLAVLSLLKFEYAVADENQPEPDSAAETEDDSSLFNDIYLNPNAIHVILEPLHRAILTSQITSPIISIEKNMGESFKTGDVLIKLDDIIYRASLKKALATFSQAELTLKSREELFTADLGSLVELREAQSQYAAAAADVAVARKQLEATTITAPYQGRIVDVYVHDYELAEALEPLLDIIGDDILLARMIVDSSLLNRVNIGTVIDIYFPEANVTVPAEIIRIGAEIDPASSTIRIDAKLENKDYKLTSGMSGMTIFPKSKTNTSTELAPETPVSVNDDPSDTNIASLDIELSELTVDYELTDEEYAAIMEEINLMDENQ